MPDVIPLNTQHAAMDISPELAQSLESRFTLYVAAENSGDVSALYGFIDPEIRMKREREYEIEPEHTLSTIQESFAQIRSAVVDSFVIEEFTNDGGRSRNHRPTAIVVSWVIYNHSQPSKLRTPWVLDGEIWYTTSLGKIPGFGD